MRIILRMGTLLAGFLCIILYQNCTQLQSVSTQDAQATSSTDDSTTEEPITGKAHYVAPVGTVLTCGSSDGTRACPFASINAAFDSKIIVSGDTVLLMDGDHAFSKITNAYDTMVTIQSENGSQARIIGIIFAATAKNIRLRNLKAWFDEGAPWLNSSVIGTYTGASYLTFENMEVRSRPDSTDYLNWTQSGGDLPQ